MTFSIDSSECVENEYDDALNDEMMDFGDLEGREISRGISKKALSKAQRKIQALLKDQVFRELVADCVRECREMWFANKEIDQVIFAKADLEKSSSSSKDKGKGWTQYKLPFPSQQRNKNSLTHATIARKAKGLHGRNVAQRRLNLRDSRIQDTITALLKNEKAVQEIKSLFSGTNYPPFFSDKQIDHLSGTQLPRGFCKSIAKFWKKHKTPIYIGAGVLAVVGAIVVVTIFTGGLGGGAAAVAGGAALDKLNDSDSPEDQPTEEKKEPKAQDTPPPPAPAPAPMQEIPLPPIPSIPTFASTLNTATFTEKLLVNTLPPIAIPNPIPQFPLGFIPNFQTGFQGIPMISPRASIPPMPSWSENAFLKFCDREVSYPTQSSFSVPAIQPISSPSWTDRVRNFLQVVGEGVVDNRDLFNLNAPLLTNPDISIRNRLQEILSQIGREIVNNPSVYEPGIELIAKPPTSSNMTVLGTLPDHFRICGINGMNTSEAEKDSHMAYIRGFAPDVSMDWVYNRSHGAPIDVMEIFGLNYNGYSPYTAEQLRQNWTNFHETNKNNPNAKLLQWGHSQGTIHLKNALLGAPQEIRDRVIVVAIAPAAIVTKDLCFKSFNYACKTDLVPYGEMVSKLIKTFATGLSSTFLDNSFSEALKDHEELIWLDPIPGSSGMNHDFQNEAFLKVITQHIKDYLKQSKG